MATIERTQNATRNIFYGVLLKMYQIVIPFIMRTAMIYFMGVQYLGLNSLFASILQVLNLAELGVGSAMVYSMYKPIAEDDETTICALMSLYRTYYRMIGLIIAVLGCALTPFVPRLIKGNIPAELNIYSLYLLNLGATVLSYWLFAYKNSILSAHQRADIGSKISIFTGTIQYLLQFLVLWLTKNYYLYIIVAMMTQVLTNIMTAICADRLYPQFKPRGKLDKAEVKKINQKVRDLFTAKLGGVIINSADTIVISAFLGLTTLAIYQNYFFIMSSVIGFIGITYVSIVAGIGNSLVTETCEKNYVDFELFTFIVCWIVGFCSSCFLNLYQPFIELWLGKDFCLPFSAVICLVLYFVIYEINQLMCTFKDAAGIWREDRFRPLASACANLGMNLCTIRFWGIYGVILSTVLSLLFVSLPWLMHNLFNTVFEQKYCKPYLVKLAIYLCVSTACCAITTLLCNVVRGNLWMVLAVRLVICCVIPNVVFLAAYIKTKELKQAYLLLNHMLGGRLGRIRKEVK